VRHRRDVEKPEQLFVRVCDECGHRRLGRSGPFRGQVYGTLSVLSGVFHELTGRVW